MTATGTNQQKRTRLILISLYALLTLHLASAALCYVRISQIEYGLHELFRLESEKTKVMIEINAQDERLVELQTLSLGDIGHGINKISELYSVLFSFLTASLICLIFVAFYIFRIRRLE